MNRKRRLLRCLGAAVLLLGLLAPSTTRAAEVDVGLKAGLNWSLLQQPADPKGAPTLMHGTAFDGIGVTGGPALHLAVASPGDGEISLEFDLLYSHHRAAGYEFNPRTGARRTATIRTDMLRFPALVRVGGNISGTEVRVGIGPELLVGFRSEATIELTGATARARPLHTRPVTHPALTAQLSADLELAPRLGTPLDLRATWDPWVGASTVDRFDGYHSPPAPGRYEVAFNWQIVVLTGVSWSGM